HAQAWDGPPSRKRSSPAGHSSMAWTSVSCAASVSLDACATRHLRGPRSDDMVRLAMRAAVMRNRKLVVADVSVPEPGPGEVLVRTLSCGICGSDLHALKFADAFVESSRLGGN